MNQQEQAIKDLLETQTLMGELGFTLTSDGSYYKDYGTADGGIARIVPVFDKGVSMDMAFKLVGFSIQTSHFVPVTQGMIVATDRLPTECRSDADKLMAKIGAQARKPMSENFMITITCSSCNNETPSFFQFGTRQVCMKCMGYGDE